MSNELAFFAAFLAFPTICCGIFHAYTLKGRVCPFSRQCTNPISFRVSFLPHAI
ncbi:RAxF-45 family protein [Jeotgalibacillus marinus]|uniref:RAxF-45 family protein n=1 Tax=Jeotgalibacillus marinus TaxID=86667 RepID=A0ABV3Q1D4_9BACL